MAGDGFDEFAIHLAQSYHILKDFLKILRMIYKLDTKSVETLQYTKKHCSVINIDSFVDRVTNES